MTGSPRPPRAVTRRTVVVAVGGAGLTVALTACGSDDDGGSSGSAGSGTSGGDTGGAGTVLAKVADIPQGGGKVIGDVVITQPVAGEFKAFSSKCTHQGCAVAGVQNNVINCPCHNSAFDASDGSVQGGPATAPLPATSIRVDGDSIIRA
ncbi:Rieske (2Fe-2S) protein [Streptomyces sp. NPDC051018]|uniref:Rieske (2Fe-2S) protein n=1 Tax=Streptomyces sp. NPDC051018 TaxID=3365639 RepID=UPI0037A32CC8